MFLLFAGKVPDPRFELNRVLKQFGWGSFQVSLETYSEMVFYIEERRNQWDWYQIVLVNEKESTLLHSFGLEEE